MLKFWKIFSLFGIALLSVVDAASKYNGKEKKVAVEEQQQLPYGILAPLKKCEKETPFYSSASFLYWQTKMGGLAFGTQNTGPTSVSDTLAQFNSREYSPHFAWNPGLKLDFGYLLPYDNWDMKLGWTYYHGNLANRNSSQTSSISPVGTGIMPVWFFPYFPGSVNFTQTLVYQNANANWNLVFNAFDLEWGRQFTINNWLSLRLHSGLKGASLHQKFIVKYDGGNTLSVSLDSNVGSDITYLKSDFHSKNNLWGIGPRVGVDSRWKLGWGINLIADSSFAIMPSYFKVTSRYEDLLLDIDGIITPSPFPATAQFTEKFLEFLPIFQTALGAEWGMCISKKTPVFLTLSATYEMQYWWDVNQTRRAISSYLPGNLYNNHGDFQTQGLTASMSLNY